MEKERTILKKSPELKTERLIMHAYLRDDSEDMLALLYNEEIKKNYMIPDFASGEEAAAMLNKIFVLSQSDEHFEYGIYLGLTETNKKARKVFKNTWFHGENVI